MLRQLFDKNSCTYTYLLSDRGETRALLIDPVQEHAQRYLTLFEELNLTPDAVSDTHTHADHITATGLIRQQSGCDILASEASEASGITRRLGHGETITYGQSEMICLHTPGHTRDSVCFYNEQENFVLTGDTLLIRGTGRTDFQQGDATQAWHSLTRVLLTLPESTRVYPGHDYNGMTVSTIGEERRCNPRLQAGSAENYRQLMGDLNLPCPKMLDVALPANLRCGLPA